jgi:hypothetical protein
MPSRPFPARPSRRLAAALVALCVLMSGIAPGVSRALLASVPPVPHDLCVADGGRPAAPPAHHGGPADEPACPLCAVHGASHAAPPPVLATFGRPAAAVRALEGLDAPRPARGGWIAAAPRGPPVPAPVA